MNGNCKVCRSRDRKRIEQHILAGKLNYTAISKKFDVPTRSIKIHKDKHIPEAVAKSMRKIMPELKPEKVNVDKRIPNISNLKECLEYIYSESLSIHHQAKDTGKEGLSLHALKQALQCLDTAMKGHELLLSYESQGSWEKILPIILAAVQHMPEAKLAISMALRTPREPVKVGSEVIDIN